jgi:DMSO/TMAO reductase YedYZ heme-binding membrane subunit
MRPSLRIIDKTLFKNSRFYILLTTFTTSLLLWWGIYTHLTDGSLALIRLEQAYGFIGLALVYLATLITPLTGAFVNLPFNPFLLHARRAIGVSAFYFSLLHVLLALFGQLGGLGSIAYLGNTYLISLSLGALALFILFLMTITSFDYAVWRLTFPRWKFLHRFVYLAIVVTLIHIILISSHVRGFLAPATQLIILASILLGSLEAIRLDRKHPAPSLAVGKVGPYTWAFMLVAALFLLSVVTANGQPAGYVPPLEHHHGVAG